MTGWQVNQEFLLFCVVATWWHQFGEYSKCRTCIIKCTVSLLLPVYWVSPPMGMSNSIYCWYPKGNTLIILTSANYTYLCEFRSATTIKVSVQSENEPLTSLKINSDWPVNVNLIYFTPVAMSTLFVMLSIFLTRSVQFKLWLADFDQRWLWLQPVHA